MGITIKSSLRFLYIFDQSGLLCSSQRLGRTVALFRDWLCIYCLLLHEDFVLSPCARKIMTFNRLFSNKLCCKTSTLLEFQIVEAHHYHRHIGCCCRRTSKFVGLIEFELSFSSKFFDLLIT